MFRVTGTSRAVAALAPLVALVAACSIDPFFVPRGDEPVTDACVPGTPELCNERDDNCDGLVDEGFSLSTDIFNCGSCTTVCAPPNALPGCRDGECTVELCLPGMADLDGEAGNGCEARCSPAETIPSAHCDGADCCDGVDNDCDGRDGEDHDTATDPENCGGCAAACLDFPCERLCAAPFAETACVGGACAITSCADGYRDADGDRLNGCEYKCAPAGDEGPTCDGVDDDCDGEIDDGVDGCSCADGDQRGCGGSPNDLACAQTCAGGAWGDCLPVPPSDGREVCDGLDNDCNGAIDDGIALTSSACGDLIEGQGALSCRSGQPDACVGYVPARSEICDGIDNDGDRDFDEGATCVGDGVQCDVDLGQCVLPCLGVDVPLRCPVDMRCVDGFCLRDLCEDATCGACERCDPSTGSCLDRCFGLACPDGLICQCGRCWPPECGVLGCPDGQVCRDDRCVDDRCADAACDPDQGCADGDCFDLCAPDQCRSFEVCVRGECVEDECHGVVCGGGECDRASGECSERCVTALCTPGRVCELATGRCVESPCARVHCPEGSTCVDGSCVLPEPPDGGPDADVDAEADGAPGTWVLATGGGGCTCRAAAASPVAHSLAALLAALLVALLAARRG